MCDGLHIDRPEAVDGVAVGVVLGVVAHGVRLHGSLAMVWRSIGVPWCGLWLLMVCSCSDRGDGVPISKA